MKIKNLKTHAVALVVLALIVFAIVGCDESSGLKVIQFEGHTYIRDTGAYHGGICHHPDCPCGKNN